jgi:hypothetical protein
MKKPKDDQIKFTYSDDPETLAGALPDVLPSRGLEHAERVPSEVGCYRTRDDKIVCGVVLAAAPVVATPVGSHHDQVAGAEAGAPRASGTTVCVADEDRGSRVCRDVVIDTIEVRHAGHDGAVDLADAAKTPSDE